MRGQGCTRRASLGLLCAAPGLLLAAGQTAVSPAGGGPTPSLDPVSEPGSRSLFDGRTLGEWKPVAFGGDGDISVVDGAIRLGRGNDLTGVVWTGTLPGPSYRLALEAMRVDGTDFFCAPTFPAGGSHCTLVVGGWGGGVVGLSSLDGLDASENETSRAMQFENRRWYRVAIDVTPARIGATIDTETVVDVDITGREVDIRAELSLCRPLGLATWRTTGAVRRIVLTERS